MINYQIYNIKDSIILHTKLINENDFERYIIQLNTDDLNLFFQIQSIQRKKEFITTRILLQQYFNLNIILSYENKKPVLDGLLIRCFCCQMHQTWGQDQILGLVDLFLILYPVQ